MALLPIAACSQPAVAPHGMRQPVSSADVPAIDSTPEALPTEDHTVAATRPPLVQSVEQTGISVECSFTAKSGSGSKDVIHAGDHVEVRFRVTDATTGSPVTNLTPAAWIDGIDSNRPESCHQKIESFLGGSLGTRAEFDLNEFYVLALNDEASITVVDPLFGYGGSKLLDLIELPSPGEDWVISSDASRLYVTMPLVNQVGVINTKTWKVIDTVDVGVQPTRLRMQPDGKYLWVSCVKMTSPGHEGSVYVIDTETSGVADRMALGRGHHDFAFSPDSRFAYISNGQTGTVFVMNVQSLTRVATDSVGQSADGIVYSSASGCAYVVDGVGGAVVVINGRTHEVIERIPDAPGLGAIKAAPNDRFVLVANKKADTVHIIDAAKNAIIQTADIGPGPEQISFSLDLAYIRTAGSERIWTIPLDQLGSGGPVSKVDFSGGHTPFGLAATPSLADGIAMAPTGVAAVVANPVDKVIYYYREGMAAPMGEFSNYGREPRAVLVVDRSLHETAPGEYSTTVQLTRAGTFDVAFLLDAPRVAHCFDLEVLERPDAPKQMKVSGIRIEPMNKKRDVEFGKPMQLRFQVRDARTGEPVTELHDLGVLTFSSSNWHQEKQAAHLGEGVYEATFTPPSPGSYRVFCQVPSMGVGYLKGPRLIMRVTPTP